MHIWGRSNTIFSIWVSERRICNYKITVWILSLVWASLSKSDAFYVEWYVEEVPVADPCPYQIWPQAAGSIGMVRYRFNDAQAIIVFFPLLHILHSGLCTYIINNNCYIYPMPNPSHRHCIAPPSVPLLLSETRVL